MSPMTKRPFQIELALLGYLYQQPLHGYQIYQLLSTSSGLGLVWRLKQSQLYALLNSFETEGLVKSSLHNQGANPPRKVFELTNEGEETFLEWIQTPINTPRQIRQEFLAKLYFAQINGKEQAAALVQKQHEECASWLAIYEGNFSRIEKDKVYERMVLRYRILHIDMILHWLEQCLQMLT